MLGKNAKGATSSFISMAHNGSFLKSLVKDYKLFTLANFQTDPGTLELQIFSKYFFLILIWLFLL